MKIPNFRGVFMRDALPKQIKPIECGIVNLDDKEKDGSHWTSYIKNKNVVYFDSYGNLKPPLDLIKYFNTEGSKGKIYYNYSPKQTFNSSNCGQLSLDFLYKNTK